MSTFKSLLAGVLALAATVTPSIARAGSPGLEAIEEFREGRAPRSAVENRFFLRERRFEIAPMLGYVPNNPFAKRYTGGVNVTYYFTETLGATGQLLYSPDLGTADLKGLVPALLRIAYNGSGSDFRQPLDKVTLGGNFGVVWAPVYGKINLIGETVLNFDLHGTAALGILAKTNYHASYIPNAPAGSLPVDLNLDGNEVEVAPVLGIGSNFFVNQTVALKLDLRAMLYIDEKPQYNTNATTVENRLYNNLIASGGVAIYFPKMQPRLYNF